MTLKDRLKQRRAGLNMTLEEVAQIVGVTRATVQKYENGIISNIPSDKIEALARALLTTPGYLMGWEDDSSGLDVVDHSSVSEPDERLKALQDNYARLNDEGRDKLVDFSADLVATGKYKKAHAFGMVEKDA